MNAFISRISLLTVIASGLAFTPAMADDDANLQKVRLGATRAALSLARRNAREALDAFLPEAEKAGTARKSFEGLLTGCDGTEVSYWDDGAVSMKVECSKADKGELAEKAPPAVQSREKKAQ